MSRMFESLAYLSPNPLCTQSLRCYIHALMRDKITTVELNSLLDSDQFVLFLEQYNNLIDLSS